mgnify:CR=1 FL=1
MAEKLNFINTKSQIQSASRLQYPSNIFSNYTDYVKFDFYKYQGPFSGDGKGKTTDINGLSPDLQKYNQSDGQQYTKYSGVEPILMYMPEDISTGYQTDWTGKGFSNIAAGALRASGSGLAGDGGGTISAFTDLIKTGAGAVPTAVAQGISTAINTIGAGDVTTEDVLQGSLGVVLNPNTELMFQGFKLRSFGLKFKMSPRNEKEALEIRKIIGTFKKVSLPNYGQQPGGATDIAKGLQKIINKGTEKTNNNYIGVPGLCTVQFMKGATLHPFLPQYKVCAITDVSINYTPDGTYSTFDGDGEGLGSPVAVELSLNFSETKLIYSNEIIRDGASY